MIDFVCFKWKPVNRYRTTFLSHHVNILRSMIERNCTVPWRLTCVTDDPSGLDPRIRYIPLWADHSALTNPSSPDRGPSCYRRLKIFSADAREWLGERIVQIDIDCVITSDITPIVSRTEDFVIWGDTNVNTPYNGSLVLFTAGCRTKLWEDFDPIKSPVLTKKLGYYGSDQAWIGACLGPGEAKFTKLDGVYSFRNEVKSGGLLPKNARIVIMHGQTDPWSHKARNFPWVKRHWV